MWPGTALRHVSEYPAVDQTSHWLVFPFWTHSYFLCQRHRFILSGPSDWRDCAVYCVSHCVFPALSICALPNWYFIRYAFRRSAFLGWDTNCKNLFPFCPHYLFFPSINHQHKNRPYGDVPRGLFFVLQNSRGMSFDHISVPDRTASFRLSILK